jgi:hypothetical protein
MSDVEQGGGAKAKRSPNFPYIGLAKALDRIEVLHGKVKHHEARVADIASDWKLSATSSGTDRNVAALEAFGLVETSGAGQNKKIKISPTGMRILDDGRPGVKEKLLAEAALRPRAIAEYAQTWRGGRPDDTHSLSQLKFEGGFNDEGARLFLRVFDETIRFTQGFQSDKKDETEVPESREDGEEEPENQGEDRSKERQPPKRQELKPGMKEDVFSLSEGNVTLQWPETLSADSYQDLEDWTKLLLRKIKRSVAVASPEGEAD